MAIPFLADSTDYERGDKPMPPIQDDVIVIGSGNVAFDVARTLVRMQNIKYGKSSVTMVALENESQVPADIEEIEEGTEEGLKFKLGWGPQEVIVDKKTGKVTGLQAQKCTRLFDENNRFSPEFDPSKTQRVSAKQVYLAIGQMADLSYIPQDVQAKMTVERGKIKFNKNRQVNGVPWLFAGGDIIRGMDIINGIADGHDAAIGIDAYIRKAKKI